MKNTYFIIALLILSSSQIVLAQLEGQKFISGTASVNFSNTNSDLQESSNNYGYNFDIGLGKFKTDTRASGWKISTSLAGSKQNFLTYVNGNPINTEKNGINGFGIGVGHFWQFYKHFNEKAGIYAGPEINARYNNSKTYQTTSNGSALGENKINTLTLSAGLSAGLYYKLSQKWWVTANIALSDFVSVDYSHLKSSVESSNNTTAQKTLNYQFSPSFRFPVVGFGVRRFL